MVTGPSVGAGRPPEIIVVVVVAVVVVVVVVVVVCLQIVYRPRHRLWMYGVVVLCSFFLPRTFVYLKAKASCRRPPKYKKKYKNIKNVKK